MKQKNSPKKNINPAGFTLFEIIVSLSLFVIIIILVNSIYLTSQRSYNKNSNQAELSQNARVAFDRMSRELRQSTKIITALPLSDTDPLNPPVDQIFFQDGHDMSQISYLRYYLNGTDLMREHKAYYFGTPSVYVYYDLLDAGNSLPQEIILEDQVVGEYLTDLEFWGTGREINLKLSFLKNQNSFTMQSLIYSRNQ